MEGVNVGVTCTRCETLLVVMQPEINQDVGDASAPVSELEFTAHIAGGRTQTGSRLVVADLNGRYRCPACGTRGQLPPPEELSTD
jgi:hypothetical protein